MGGSKEQNLFESIKSGDTVGAIKLLAKNTINSNGTLIGKRGGKNQQHPAISSSSTNSSKLLARFLIFFC
jgi:hypothetical protein